MTKPFSSSADSNKLPILQVLRTALAEASRILEIGSGTGQHAVHFGAALPHLHWQTSDRTENHPGILATLHAAGLSNVAPPLALDVNDLPWPIAPVDAVYSANTAHIMDWTAVRAMFAGVAQVLRDPPTGAGQFLLYGPFAYQGRHTSTGNAAFDRSLRAGGVGAGSGTAGTGTAGMGIRDLVDLEALAVATGLRLSDDLAMPVNNRILVFRPAQEGSGTSSASTGAGGSSPRGSADPSTVPPAPA